MFARHSSILRIFRCCAIGVVLYYTWKHVLYLDVQKHHGLQELTNGTTTNRTTERYIGAKYSH